MRLTSPRDEREAFVAPFQEPSTSELVTTQVNNTRTVKNEPSLLELELQQSSFLLARGGGEGGKLLEWSGRRWNGWEEVCDNLEQLRRHLDLMWPVDWMAKIKIFSFTSLQIPSLCWSLAWLVKMAWVVLLTTSFGMISFFFIFSLICIWVNGESSASS